MFTGCGTALVTPFRSDLSLDEDDAAASGPAADRRRRALPRALRHDRRESDAQPEGTPARRRDHARGSQGQSARGRRRRRLQHGRSRRAGQGARGHGSRWPAVGDALLQSPDAGRALPALQGDRGRDPAADRRLQRPRPHRHERHARDAAAAGLDRQHRRRQGSFGQHQPDGADLPVDAEDVRGAFGRRRGHRCR